MGAGFLPPPAIREPWLGEVSGRAHCGAHDEHGATSAQRLRVRRPCRSRDSIRDASKDGAWLQLARPRTLRGGWRFWGAPQQGSSPPVPASARLVREPQRGLPGQPQPSLAVKNNSPPRPGALSGVAPLTSHAIPLVLHGLAENFVCVV
ncbi:uncharacterized protein PHACADRAFT_205712 [Phanerochaete carnosa HHB-10118-sp]|uniref:Uncharacterized protein n=1 Tax=Phanerochaete carnosa (strain HHB-10118-sp) TaxID=650164 RepID=K5WJB9_PHACS|nr:uncharacterized protein PHACADRAFT_205712 [Phanerochaete carnosa HHB-10118-sp]EKM59495.1 hypothetical protein PHACADRAFT_205712 [Phanerochaete carnosa HHB-10118-sp]